MKENQDNYWKFSEELEKKYNFKNPKLNKRKLFFLKKFNFKNSKIIIPTILIIITIIISIIISTIIINNQYLTLNQAINDINNKYKKKYTINDIRWDSRSTYKISNQVWYINLDDRIIYLDNNHNVIVI